MDIEGVCFDTARRRQVSYYSQTLLARLGAVDAPADSVECASAYRERGVFLKGLRKSTTPQDVSDSLSRFGKVVLIRMPLNTKKNHNIGFAYVFFQEATTAQWLLQEVKEVLVDCKSIKVSPFYLTKDLCPVRKTPCRSQEERMAHRPQKSVLVTNPSSDSDGDSFYRSIAVRSTSKSLRMCWLAKPTSRHYWDIDDRNDTTHPHGCEDLNVRFRLSHPLKARSMIDSGQTDTIQT